MKLLNMNLENTTQYDLKAVPANLHDTAEEVYDDKLYSLYTITNNVIDNNIRVGLVVNDLVQHTAGNGMKGYWVGIGISADLIAGSLTYAGWGTLPDEELLTMETAEPDGEQEVNGKKYLTYYFDAASAAAHDDIASVVVDKEGIHYHYLIDFSTVNMVTSPEKLDEIAWSAVSVQTVKDNYLFGINLADSNGNPLPEGLFVHYLNAAVDYIQTLLDIVIAPTDFTDERHDYFRTDYQNWGFIQLDHNPVRKVKSISLMYGDQRTVSIPLDWVQLDKLSGEITLFPSAGSANTLIIGQTGLMFGFQSQWDWAPRLWSVDYEAGVDENDPMVPFSLLKETIFKRASMGILNVWGKGLYDCDVA